MLKEEFVFILKIFLQLVELEGVGDKFKSDDALYKRAKKRKSQQGLAQISNFAKAFDLEFSKGKLSVISYYVPFLLT